MSRNRVLDCFLFLQTQKRKSKERRRERSGQPRGRRSWRKKRSEFICEIVNSLSLFKVKDAVLLFQAEMMLLLEDDDAKHEHFNYDKIVEQQNLSKKKRKKMRKKEELMGHDEFQVCMKSLQNKL